MTAADLLIAGLRARGVEWMATLCGHGLDPLFQAARDGGIRLVDTRNEQTASYIAEAYGRLTRRPGVCAVSSGVAVLNALTGAANAWFDRSPMLLISGAANSDTAGQGHFQDMDQVKVAAPVMKMSRAIDHAERTLQILDEVWTAALTDPPGPVHLMFPMDVQRTAVAENAIIPFTRPDPRSEPATTDYSAVASAMAAAARPLVVAGSGVFYRNAGAAMLRFCEDWNVPVVTPIWDRGVVDAPSGVFVGVVGAATGGPELLSNSDCILMADAEPDYRVGYLRPPVVSPNTSVVYFRGDWNQLSAACRDQQIGRSGQWLAECVRLRDAFRDTVEQRAREQATDRLHAADVIETIRSILDEQPVFLIDGGSIGQWAHQLLCWNRYPQDWLTCGRSGVVGWGLGGAIAARLAHPGRPVLLLSGDGAFTFNVADLESAVRQNLSFVVIVADDLGWGITRAGHMRQFGEPIASSLGPVAFDSLAMSLGARGVRVATVTDLSRELRLAFQHHAVTVIHVPISGGNP